MNRFLISTITLFISTLFAVQASAIAIDLGQASKYNAFLKNDFTTQTADTQGRIAVGGDFNVNGNHDIGFRIDDYGMGDGPSLVVGGNVNKSGGASFNVYGNAPAPASGDLVYAGQVINNGQVITSRVGGQIEANFVKVDKNSLPVDFDSAFAHLNKLSTDLMAATVHGVGIKDNQRDGSPLVFTPTTTPGDNVYVFNVSQEEINANSSIFVEGVSSDATIVFNITNENNVAGKGNWKNYECAEGQKNCAELSQIAVSINGELVSDHLNKKDLDNRLDNQVLFNFGNATNVNIAASVYGSILAPNADIKGVSGHVYGQIIGKSWESDMQINYNPFTAVGSTPVEPTPVPTPTTVWIFALAFALLYVNRNSIARAKRNSK
ncbi:MAG: choice-of-anchor A family protein [Colwellia sp.]|nr:choice-of-anchor A family protein [Colwellia sp.]